MDAQFSSRLEYRKRIQKALTYIRQNLDKPITIKDVAKAACYSEFHFHRIFSVMMGEPLGEYITRKKLEQAAIRLVYSPQNSVSKLAFRYGYSSVSAFSKAFHQWFGCRPTEVTKIKDCLDAGNGKLQTKYAKSIESNQLYVAPEPGDFQQRFNEINDGLVVRDIESFQVAFLTSKQGYELESVRNTWLEMQDRLEDAGIHPESVKSYAISHDHPGLVPFSQCRYDACVWTSTSNLEKLLLSTTEIPSGRYVTYRVQGPESSILAKYLEFCTVWLPGSGYEWDNFPVVEHYPDQSCEGSITAELWAKVICLTYD